jgi:hypothetical protein
MNSHKPGERDSRHRVFLGWRVRWPDNSSPLGPFAERRFAARIVEDQDDGSRIARVYRPESKVRRALRELVEACNLGRAHPWNRVYKRAVEVLRGEKEKG